MGFKISECNSNLENLRRIRVPRGSKDVERFGENVIIHETSVHGEHSHQHNDVATSKEHTEDLERQKWGDMSTYLLICFIQKTSTFIILVMFGIARTLFLLIHVHVNFVNSLSREFSVQIQNSQ